MMNNFPGNIFLLCLAMSGESVVAQSHSGYVSLDGSNPIAFYGDSIGYDGLSIRLGERALFVDGQLPDDVADRYPFVYNDFRKAAANFSSGCADEPMSVYIAPYVYWIDNPDDPQIRMGRDGREPFGLTVDCDYLHLTGLNPDPGAIVLASARGQTHGAVGNFTMFDFHGDGLMVSNLTMGNYCNVDLEFPLRPSLGRGKRTPAVTQAHVAYCNGDKVVARNVRFISRLNMNPLSGARRILFDRCHLECTDDALAGTGVYLNCSFGLYGQRPFWRSDMGGAVFLDCDFNILHNNDRHFFCKSVGPLSIIDCRYHGSEDVYAGWTNVPADWLRCYQHDVRFNDKPYIIGKEKPCNTVSLEGRNQLNAFRVELEGKVVYNTYNLLRGDDGWDPLLVAPSIELAGKNAGKDYANMATCLSIDKLSAELQTGGEALTLRSTLKRHSNYVLNNEPVMWRVEPGFEKYVRLTVSQGYDCQVEACNDDDQSRSFTVIAYTAGGLECATELVVKPSFIDAPAFLENPRLKISNNIASLEYELDLGGRSDESIVTWYRCSDRKGAGRIAVAVTRMNEPVLNYRLSKADVGHYLMATIEPKHLRCHPGKVVAVVSDAPVATGDVSPENSYETDFRNFPCANQPQVIPGFWTVGGYKPFDTAGFDWELYPEKHYWDYGYGINGARGTGLLQVQRGSRLLYTPLDAAYGDMEVVLNVDPCKTAGQGFGSATGQYMDVYIKFDTRTLSGYALRIERTTKYSNAVDFRLVKYDNGRVEPVSESVSSICYRTDCTIRLRYIDGVLSAEVASTTPLPEIKDQALKRSVDLKARVEENSYGGTGIQHTGTWGENATMIHRIRMEWK